MAKNVFKDYLDFHIEKCYMYSKANDIPITYGDCLDMVYMNSVLTITDSNNKSIKIKYDKDKMKIITIED